MKKKTKSEIVDAADKDRAYKMFIVLTRLQSVEQIKT